MLNHKTSLNKFKKIAIIPSIFSEYNALKLETNCKREVKKKIHTTHKYVEIKQHTTKIDWVKEEIKVR